MSISYMSSCPLGPRPSQETPPSQTPLRPPATALFPEDSAGPTVSQRKAHMPLSRSFLLPLPSLTIVASKPFLFPALKTPAQVKLKTSTTHFSCSAITTFSATFMKDFSTQLIASFSSQGLIQQPNLSAFRPPCRHHFSPSASAISSLGCVLIYVITHFRCHS